MVQCIRYWDIWLAMHKGNIVVCLLCYINFLQYYKPWFGFMNLFLIGHKIWFSHLTSPIFWNKPQKYLSYLSYVFDYLMYYLKFCIPMFLLWTLPWYFFMYVKTVPFHVLGKCNGISIIPIILCGFSHPYG